MDSVVIVSPSGNMEVWPEDKVAEKLSQGYLPLTYWLDIQDAKALEERQAWLNNKETEPGRFQSLRLARDTRIAATDYLMAPDYPLDETRRQAAIAYRQALRDLPAQPGAPWDGGGEMTPWPEM